MTTIEALYASIKSGDLAQTFSLVDNKPENEVTELLIKAGFTIQHFTQRNKRSFWADIQHKLTLACKERKNGWELRAGSNGGE